MSKQSELALKLNGREYREEITNEEAERAFDDGLIVVHGGSDDLCYFAGLYADEKGAWEGNTWWWIGEAFEGERELPRRLGMIGQKDGGKNGKDVP